MGQPGSRVRPDCDQICLCVSHGGQCSGTRIAVGQFSAPRNPPPGQRGQDFSGFRCSLRTRIAAGPVVAAVGIRKGAQMFRTVCDRSEPAQSGVPPSRRHVARSREWSAVLPTNRSRTGRRLWRARTISSAPSRRDWRTISSKGRPTTTLPVIETLIPRFFARAVARTILLLMAVSAWALRSGSSYSSGVSTCNKCTAAPR